MLFPFPVTIRVKHLFLLLLVIAGLGLLFSKAGQVSHAGHFGGAIGGLLYAHYFMGRRSPVFVAQSEPVRPKARKTAPVAKVTRIFGQKASRVQKPAELTREEFISREIDPILEKISAHGMHSLTDKERRLLESARSKLDGRSR